MAWIFPVDHIRYETVGAPRGQAGAPRRLRVRRGTSSQNLCTSSAFFHPRKRGWTLCNICFIVAVLYVCEYHLVFASQYGPSDLYMMTQHWFLRTAGLSSAPSLFRWIIAPLSLHPFLVSDPLAPDSSPRGSGFVL